MNKAEQRNICLSRRRELPQEKRKEYSQIICGKLSDYLNDKKAMSYLPYGSEVDVTEINERFSPAFPVTDGNGFMEAYVPDDEGYLIDSHGIREPDPERSQFIDRKQLEVIVVPLVGFDAGCRRLGHGAGYYDRYLEGTDALKIGVAYEVQKLDEIITDEHDIPLDLIITETETYKKGD